MGEHGAIDTDRLFVAAKQIVEVDDVFNDDDLILDLGGGGEGVVGQLRGKQVVAVDIRKEELEESADGPIKVIANAKDLPFLDASFDAATAFFFLMYVPASDRKAVLAETHRVLRPGGRLTIWDATILAPSDPSKQVFVVPIQANLPDRSIQTGYGVRWQGHEMTVESIAQVARDIGFTVESRNEHEAHFRMVLYRSPSDSAITP